MCLKQSAQRSPKLGQPEPCQELVAEISTETRSDHDTHSLTIKILLQTTTLLQSLLGRVEEHELKRVGICHLFGRDPVPPPIVVVIRDETATLAVAAIGARACRVTE